MITGYENIVDIGCAEGYYAVGLAYRQKNNLNLRVYAYDTNDKALKNLSELAEINYVQEKICTKGNFAHEEFKAFQHKKTLIFCDIEGDELFLLDPELAPTLLQYDILVEVHDGGHRSNAIKDKLYSRFEKTHQIQLIAFSGRTAEDYAAITWTNDIRQKQRAVAEGRKYGLEWMWMKTKN